MTHSALYMDLRHDYFRVCAFIAWCALIRNFLPAYEPLIRHKRLCLIYRIFIDCVSAFSLSIRTQLPSLDLEIFGFRREVRHGVRNWRQRRIDRRYVK